MSRRKIENLEPQKLQEIWIKILKDRDAQEAFGRLKTDGFEIPQRALQDTNFRHPSWALYIAAIPLLPNRPARRRIYGHAALQKHRGIVRALRQLAKQIDDPFCDVRIMSTIDYSISEISRLQKRVTETADFVEQFISWDWSTRNRNPRNALIAELRWTIRERTGRPHDSELGVLIYAAFRAAGVTEDA